MRNDQSYEPQHPVSQNCLFGSPVLRADNQPPERIASHDFHQPLGVSDRSVVSGFYSCPPLSTHLLNRFVHYFVGSLRWFQRHRQIPSARCRRELNLLPRSRIKTETLPLRSETDPSTTISHLRDSHLRSSAIDFSAVNDHWLSGAQDPLSLVIHFCLGLQWCTHIRADNLCESNVHM